MVSFTTLALVILSFSSAIARPTEHHRHVARHLAEIDVIKRGKTDDSSSDGPLPASTTRKAASQSTTASAESETTNAKNSGGGISGTSGQAKALFPVSGGLKNAWSVSPSIDGNLPFNMKTLKAYKGRMNTDIGKYQGRTALRGPMKKGSISPGNKDAPQGGFSFYAKGAKDLSVGKEYLFSYSVHFQSGFAFNKGGKLPGLYGGTDDDVAATCSGGRHNPNCWSGRLMWREGGQGEFYAYLPPGHKENKNKCGKKANGPCESEYGMSVGRGTWKWTPGQWQTVAQRIKLNDVGKANGEVEIWIDGKSVLQVNGLIYRTSSKAVARGAQMQIFFGGHTKEWASPKDQDVYFSDFSAAVLS